MTCSSGKSSYSSRTKAKIVCKTVKALGKGNQHTICKTKLMPYECKECGMWHLTHMGKLPGRNDTKE